MPHGGSIGADLVAGTRDGVVDHLEADQLAFGTGRLDRLQRGAADEIALLELHDAAHVRLERIRVTPELVAVQRHPRLEAQGVTRAEPAGPQAMPIARIGDGRPQLARAARVAEELEAV